MTRYRIADDVAWVSQEDLDVHGVPTAYVTSLPYGPPTTLEGTSCVVWLALADGGTEAEISAAAAHLWGADPAQVTTDVVALLDFLVRAGLATTG